LQGEHGEEALAARLRQVGRGEPRCPHAPRGPALSPLFSTPSCAYSAAPDLAYFWTAPYSGTFTFTTSGSSYDTLLHIYNRSTGAALGCNDGSGGTRQSSIALNLSAGPQLRIVVDGYAGNCGNFRLNITSGGDRRRRSGP
jgi:hypothetical protein